jgi:hypothetical protein
LIADDNVPSWWIKSTNLAKAVPHSVTEGRTNLTTGWGEFPLAIRTKDGRTEIVMPTSEPTDSETLTAIGIIMSIASNEGWNIVPATKTENDAMVFESLKVLAGALRGAFIAYRQNPLGPVGSLPAFYKVGYEYLTFWALSEATKGISHDDCLTIPRHSSLSPGNISVWKKSGYLSIMNRVEFIIRSAAVSASKRIRPFKDFLKSPEFFKQKFVGKKPVPGIYTQEELSMLQQDWNARNQHIEETHKRVASMSYSEIRLTGLRSTIDSFATPYKGVIKTIVETANKRVPHLLTTVRQKGRAAVTMIAKGGTLVEKIRSMDPENVRTPAKLLWSPLRAPVTESGFAESVLSLVNHALRHNGNFRDALAKRAESIDVDWFHAESQTESYIGELSEAVTLYLDLYPDHRGKPAWDALAY